MQAEALTVKSLRYTGYMYYIWLLLPVALFLFYLPDPVRGIVLAVVVLLIGIIAWHFCRTGTVEGVMKQTAHPSRHGPSAQLA